MDDTTMRALGRVRLGMRQVQAQLLTLELVGGEGSRGWTAWGEPIRLDPTLRADVLEVRGGGVVFARVRIDTSQLLEHVTPQP
jgi:hypothetical protein